MKRRAFLKSMVAAPVAAKAATDALVDEIVKPDLVGGPVLHGGYSDAQVNHDLQASAFNLFQAVGGKIPETVLDEWRRNSHRDRPRVPVSIAVLRSVSPAAKVAMAARHDMALREADYIRRWKRTAFNLPDEVVEFYRKTGNW
jgi:hypothetical protein